MLNKTHAAALKGAHLEQQQEMERAGYGAVAEALLPCKREQKEVKETKRRSAYWTYGPSGVPYPKADDVDPYAWSVTGNTRSKFAEAAAVSFGN